jgi:two-component system NtrC family sensor kinase
MGTTIDEVAFSLLQHQLRGQERQATLVRAASSVTHALATPLSVISGRVALLGAAGGGPAGVERNVAIIQEQLGLITELLKRLVAFARAEPSAADPVDLVELARDAVALMQPVASQQGMTLACTAGGSLLAAAARTALVHLLTTILSVGILTAAPGSTISLELESREAEPPPPERGRVRPGPYACFSVRCPDCRLPDSVLEDVYQPWFAQQSATERSLALALAVAWGVAREHGGWVDTQLDSASRTVFSINWPLCSS